MAFDAHSNFAYTTVLTPPSPATSGTSLVVAAGTGVRFPTATSFNATIWPTGVNALSSNAEIVRVTAISTDTFTITRTQEGSSARTIVAGDQIALTITAKTLTDIETSAFLSNRVIYSAAYVASSTFTLAATPTKIYQVTVYNSSSPMNVPVAAYTWTAGTNSVTITDTLAAGDTVYFDVELAATAATSYVPNTVVNSVLTAGATLTATVKTFFRCDATSGSFTLTLPTAVGNGGLELTFKKTDSSANTVTLDGATTETIDDGLTAVISRQYTSLTLISDNSNWQIT